MTQIMIGNKSWMGDSIVGQSASVKRHHRVLEFDLVSCLPAHITTQTMAVGRYIIDDDR